MSERRTTPHEPLDAVPAAESVVEPAAEVDLATVSPRFEGEPAESVRARADAQRTVRWLKQRCGGSESALRRAMARTEPAPPSTSTIGQWSRGEVSSRKKSTRTAYTFDRFGRTLPGYPPTGRTLQAIVQDVAPVPGRGRSAAVSAPVSAPVSFATTDAAGETVVIDARVRLAPGEQVAGAEVTGLRESSDGRLRQITVTIVVTAVLAALVVAGIVLFGGGEDQARRDDPAVPPTVSASVRAPRNDAGVPVAASLALDDTNFCGWHLGTKPIPLVSLEPLVMRIDARCNYPAEPDPGKDLGAAVYSRPSNDQERLAVGRLGDGSAFRPQCWVVGKRVTDGATPTNASRLWIRVDSPDGYVPDVNVGGGYTVTQLRGLGMARCPTS